MIHALFSQFYRAVDARGLEKIKTVGDAYMVASGVPIAQTDHTKHLLRLVNEVWSSSGGTMTTQVASWSDVSESTPAHSPPA